MGGCRLGQDWHVHLGHSQILMRGLRNLPACAREAPLDSNLALWSLSEAVGVAETANLDLLVACSLRSLAKACIIDSKGAMLII